jgi:quercetin dioxygenase-like cupin family protein
MLRKCLMRNTRLVIAASIFGLALQAGSTALSQTSTASSQISITSLNKQSVTKGSHERFTGDVQVRALFAPEGQSRTSGGQVTFQPGARSAWHTHPLGQILIITDGTGWIQEWGGPVREMHKGDVIWIPAGVKHWHGATPTTAVTHMAIQEIENGSAVTWMEQVTDQQYRQAK